MDPPATVAPLSTPISAAALSVAGGRAGGRTPVGGFRSGSAQSNEAVSQLQAHVKELSTNLEGLEKERDFYFEKVCKTGKKINKLDCLMMGSIFGLCFFPLHLLNS